MSFTHSKVIFNFKGERNGQGLSSTIILVTLTRAIFVFIADF